MTDLEQVLYDLVRPMVDEPDQLSVTETVTEDGKLTTLHVAASDEDIARLIGRKGSMATALRQVMSVASHRENKKVAISFEQKESA